MKRAAVVTSVVLCALGLSAPSWAQTSSVADPSATQIYQAARTGHLGDAEQMVGQVLRDHPESGKAHYVAAEVYARAGATARARAELSQAQSLQPGLPFTTPAAVQALQRQLAGAAVSGAPPVSSVPRSSVPWGFILLIVGVVIVWAVARRRANASNYANYGGAPAASGMPNVVPPYGSPGYGYGANPGSGLMGNIATGLAVGAGVAAGEELVRHAFGGGNSVIPNAGASEAVDNVPQNADMGGADFGVTDPGNWDSGGDSFGGDIGGGGDWN